MSMNELVNSIDFTKFGLRCIFPSYYEPICRVTLELLNNNEYFDPFIILTEDYVCKIFDIDDIKKKNNNISEEIIQYLLSIYFHNISILNINNNNNDNNNILHVHQKISSTSVHPNITNIMYFMKTNNNKIILFQEYVKHSLNSLLKFHKNTSLFTPTLSRSLGLGAKDLRCRFLIYQLLQTIAYIHSQKLCLTLNNSFNTNNIYLDDYMWMVFPLDINERIITCLMNNINIKNNNINNNNINNNNINNNINNNNNNNNNKIPKPINYYDSVIVQWINGKISNFEYLMQLNIAAGRNIIDPVHHTIFPWLTDFSIDLLQYDNGNNNNNSIEYQLNRKELFSKYLRDLTKTKFRLSKGDAQLETTYAHSIPPHHIPESLSELTYCIYMARITPLHILRRVVRNEFVPGHYPHSMTRMYEWSPDECIPEFFINTNVFKSIHKKHDFYDIELPSFANTPEHFLIYHRKLLESDEVSNLLHYWIDLTFGYCLSGDAAIENMNVQLKHTFTNKEQLGDGPNLDKHPGCVQLFYHRHPTKHITKNKFIPNNNNNNNNVNNLNNLNNDNDYKYYENHIKKYENVHNTYNNKNMDMNNVINKLLDFDDELNLSFSSRNNIHNNDSFNQMSEKAKQIFLNSTQIMDTKKSLICPQMRDPTLITLKNIPLLNLNEIDKNNDCINSIDKFTTLTNEYNFVKAYTSYIQPSYELYELDYLDNELNLENDPFFISYNNNNNNKFGWDCEIYNLLIEISNNNNNNNNNNNKILKLQEVDMFTIGCIIGEIYTSKSLFSIFDTFQLSNVLKNSNKKIAHENYFKIIRQLLNEQSEYIPLTVRRLIISLLHYDTSIRPTAAELLKYCNCIDHYSLKPEEKEDPWYSDNDLISRKNSMEANETINNNNENNNEIENQENRYEITEFLSNYCNQIFPSYFRSVYLFIGRLRLCQSDIEKFNVVLLNLDLLRTVPLEGFGLCLPYILNIISNPKPFRIYEEKFQHLEMNYVHNNSDSPILTHYITLIDVICNRLGIDTSEKIVIPKLIDFMNKLLSPQLLRMLLYSNLWQIIIQRSGIKCFLRQFLPMLLTYLLSGTLQNLSHSNIINNIASSPDDINNNNNTTLSTFWSLFSEEARDGIDWLHYTNPKNIKLVQQAAKVTICRLSYPDYLGSGLCTRYVVPALLCLIGIPTLSASAFHHHPPIYFNINENNNENNNEYNNNNNNNNNRIMDQYKKILLTEEFIKSLFLNNNSNDDDDVNNNNNNNNRRTASHVMRKLTQDELSIVETISNVIDIKDIDHSISLSELTKLNKENILQDLTLNSNLNNNVNDNYINNINEEKNKIKLEDGSILPDNIRKLMIKQYIETNTIYDVQEMYVVRSLISICSNIGELTTSELILSKIFHYIIPHLDSLLSHALRITPTNKLNLHVSSNINQHLKSSNFNINSLSNILSAFMEIIQILNGILPNLSSEIVIEYYLQPSKWSHITISNMLLILPLTIPKLYLYNWENDEDISSYEELEEIIDFNRQCNIYSELCKLLVSCCMYVGSDATIEYVLPIINKFFGHFVQVYSILSVESKIMYKMFKLGSELFTPLVQLVGAEIFYTLVPHLNPRLEMWLLCINSGHECKTPPLPSNILPENIGQVETKKQEQKKGFFNWLSNKLTSDNNNSNNTVNINNNNDKYSNAIPINNNINNINNNININVNNNTNPTSPTLFLGPRKKSYSTNRNILQPTITIDNSIMLQEFAIQMDRQSSLLMATRLSNVYLSNDNNYNNIDNNNNNNNNNNTLMTPISININNNRKINTSVNNNNNNNNNNKLELSPKVLTPKSTRLKVLNVFYNDNNENNNLESNNDDYININNNNNNNNRNNDNSIDDDYQLNTISMNNENILVDDDFFNIDEQYFNDINTFTEPPTIPLLTTLLKYNNNRNNRTLSTTDSYNDKLNNNNLINKNDSATKKSFGIHDIGTGKLVREVSNHILDRIHHHHNPSNHNNNNNNNNTLSPLATRNMLASMAINNTLSNNNINDYEDEKNIISNNIIGTSTNINFNINLTAEEQLKDDLYYDEATWLLAGGGRWNMMKELELKTSTPINDNNNNNNNVKRTITSGGNINFNNNNNINNNNQLNDSLTSIISSSPILNSFGYAANTGQAANKFREKYPVAQVSLTAPRIALDSANEAMGIFQLSYQNTTQFTVEDNLQCRIRCMVINPIESLLMTSSRSGVKLWSLNSQPIKSVAQYSHHSYVPFCANFLRNGTQMVTCDGSISIWDIETQKTLVFIGTATGSIGGLMNNNVNNNYSNNSNSNNNNNNLNTNSNVNNNNFNNNINNMNNINPINNITNNINDNLRSILNVNNIYSSNTLDRCCFSYMQTISPKLGISPNLCPYGDDQIIGCNNMNLTYFDFRQYSIKPLRSVAEWKLPIYSNIQTNSNILSYLTCSATFDDYIVAGSSFGYLYIVDRRSGKLLADIQGHDCSIIKLFMLNRNQFLSVTEKSTFVWEISNGNDICKKLYSIKGLPDNTSNYSLNTILMHSFEQNFTTGTSNMGVHSQDMSMTPTKLTNTLYCISGNKISSGKLPDVKNNNYNNYSSTSSKYNKDAIEKGDDFKLDTNYFIDRTNTKINKNKLHIASATLLPLRRIMLLGADDGTVKVIC